MESLRIVSVRDDFFNDYKLDDAELLHNSEHGLSRPYVIIVKLKFQGRSQDFAIPFRSNIRGRVDKNTYFSLPPRKETKLNSSHGLDFIKMFPVDKAYFLKYNYPGNNKSASLTKQFIQKNLKKIVISAQNYLISFENGNRPEFCIDIEKIQGALHKKKEAMTV